MEQTKNQRNRYLALFVASGLLLALVGSFLSTWFYNRLVLKSEIEATVQVFLDSKGKSTTNNNIAALSKQSDITDVMDKVETFYDHRFNTLLFTFSAIITIFGLGLPILFALLGQLSIKDEVKRIDIMAENISKQKEEIISEITKRTNQETDKIQVEFDRQLGKTYQGLAKSFCSCYHHTMNPSFMTAAIVFVTQAMSYNANSRLAREVSLNIRFLSSIVNEMNKPANRSNWEEVRKELKKYEWPIGPRELEHIPELSTEDLNAYFTLFETFCRSADVNA